MHQATCLFQPYDPYRSCPDIYSKLFLPGDRRITLRPVCLPGDLAIVNRWFAGYFNNGAGTNAQNVRYSEDFYTTMLGSTHSQSLLGSMDDRPAFQVDIYHSVFAPDSLQQTGRVSKGDYIMQLMHDPEMLDSLTGSICLLLACLDCFFSYAEVSRVIWMTGIREKYLHMIAAMTEFDELECDDPFQSFHILTKDAFNQLQEKMPVWPAQEQVLQD